jgi:peptide/nickel transport system substrate-binding protein
MSKRDIFIGILIFFALIIFINQDFFFNDLPNKIFGPQHYKKETLQIVLNTPATDLSEYSLNLNNLIRTANIYEGLVAFDRNLRFIPALAVSWGNLNPTTWEFKLREEVAFHDQSLFDAQSVVTSFNNAQSSGSSQAKSLLSTIKEINVVDPYTVRIITNEPDPLILSKLTKFYISKPNRIGTGSYVYTDWQKGNKLSLTAFPNYWGKQPIYQNVEYKVVKSKRQRQKDFEEGLIDILVAVPRDQALILPEEQVKTSYSLEVNFLMFKLDDPLLKDRKTREAIMTVFDPEKIEEIGNFFVRQVSQFVAPGVYGYNPNIPMHEFSEENRAKNLFGQQRKKLTLDFLSTYKTLADYLAKQLLDAGFLVSANAISPENLLSNIKENKSQMFIIGWQAENGDAGDFLDAFIHSEGEFNNGRYKNAFVDKLIEKSSQELDPAIRLKTLQQIIELVDKDLIGIPLFESSRLYALKKGLSWEPRLDGLVLATDVK